MDDEEEMQGSLGQELEEFEQQLSQPNMVRRIALGLFVATALCVCAVALLSALIK